MKKHLINLLIGVILLVVGWNVASHGDTITSKEELQNMKSFCDNSQNTVGYIQDSFNITTMKIGKVRTKMYQFRYDFTVQDVPYSASFTSSSESAKPISKVWYDKNDPATNAVSDPCELYKKTASEKTIGSKGFYYITGVLLIIIGFGMVSSNFGGIMRAIFARTTA